MIIDKINWADDRLVLKFTHITGGCTNARLKRLKRALLAYRLPSAAWDLREVQDEHTGRRYGKAKKRAGWAVKIGGGGRNQGSRYAYQVWAVVKPEHRKRKKEGQHGNTQL